MTREAAIELIERIPYVTTINALSSRMRLDFCKKAAQSKDPLIWIKAIKSAYIQKDHNSKAYSDIVFCKPQILKIAKKNPHPHLGKFSLWRLSFSPCCLNHRRAGCNYGAQVCLS